MAVESKPLFHPEAIRQRFRSFTLPPAVGEALPKLKQWADRITSGEADKLKETALLPDFLTDIFGALLGYTGPVGGGDTYTLSRETNVVVDGLKVNAVKDWRNETKPGGFSRIRSGSKTRPFLSPAQRAGYWIAKLPGGPTDCDTAEPQPPVAALQAANPVPVTTQPAGLRNAGPLALKNSNP